MKALLCGPMTGDMKIDRPNFQQYEDKLKSAGIEVINPIKVIESYWQEAGSAVKPPEAKIDDTVWKDFCEIRLVLNELAFCDAVFLMPDWYFAINAIIVAFAAQAMNRKKLYYEADVLFKKNIGLIAEFGSNFGLGTDVIFTSPDEAKQIGDKIKNAIDYNEENYDDGDDEDEESDNDYDSDVQDVEEEMSAGKDFAKMVEEFQPDYADIYDKDEEDDFDSGTKDGKRTDNRERIYPFDEITTVEQQATLINHIMAKASGDNSGQWLDKQLEPDVFKFRRRRDARKNKS